jgi:hypothetical protein
LIAGFPEVRIEAGPHRHADAPVFVEVTLTGTHQGEWARIPATGRQASVRIACLYEFEQDRLVWSAYGSTPLRSCVSLARSPPNQGDNGLTSTLTPRRPQAM